MRRIIATVVSLMTLVSTSAHAQSIAATVAAAESEGATFPRYASSLPTQRLTSSVSSPAGYSDRRCLNDSLASVSPRSGEFIARGVSNLVATKAHKILWLPLHGSSLAGEPLVIRASRLGHPDDAFRLAVARPARSRGVDGPLYGYPSSVKFPAAGVWLVVATAGSDWGCFVVEVGEPSASGGSR